VRRLRIPVTAGYAGLLIALGILGLALYVSAPNDGDFSRVSGFIFLADPIFVAAVGGLLAARRPDSWAGWDLLIVATAYITDSLSKGVISHYLAGERWPHVPWAAWLDNWTWTVMFAGLLFAILRFAQGTERARVLRGIGWAGLWSFGALALVCASATHSVSHTAVATPVSFGFDLTNDSIAVAIPFAVGVVGLLCATAALIIGRRHAAGTERAQLRWLLWSFSLFITVLVVSEAVSDVSTALHIHAPLVDDTLDVISQLAFLSIPVAMYISVTRYGLFEIDRVISRTVTYSVLTALLTISYVGIVTATTRLLPDRFNAVGVAAATLAVAALFLPVRRRLLAVMDRRFNRTRLDAEQVINAFAERVRRDDAHDPNGTELLAAVHQVFQPARASVWLFSPGTGPR
jgi:hypothetical protein